MYDIKNEPNNVIKYKTLDLVLWDGSASVVALVVAVHTLVNVITQFQNKFVYTAGKLPSKFGKITPSLVGLLSIPFIIKPCLYSTDRSSNLLKHNETNKHLCRVQCEKQGNVDVYTFIDSVKPNIKTIVTEKKAKKKMVVKKDVIIRQKIPLTLKLLVWDHWVGNDIGKTKCLCCKNIDTLQGSFECGHIVAHVNGGDLSITNLKI